MFINNISILFVLSNNGAVVLYRILKLFIWMFNEEYANKNLGDLD